MSAPTLEQRKRALVYWAKQATHGLGVPGVIWSDQDGPKVQRPYVTLRIDSVRAVGMDERRAIDDDGYRVVAGPRIMTIAVTVLGVGAIGIAEDLRDSLSLDQHLRALAREGLAHLSSQPVQNITTSLDAGSEERAAFEVRFIYASEKSEFVGTIEQVTVDPDFEESPSGDTLDTSPFTSPFTVPAP